MPTHRLHMHLATMALLGLALVAGCSTDPSGNSAQKLLGVDGRMAGAENGLALSADPSRIVIDPADPAAPTDPNHGNERYGQAALLAVATDETGQPQEGLKVTFATTAGMLFSGGDTLVTDALGHVTDTLRVYESDPDVIEVSVSDGTRTTSITVTKIVAAPPVANAGPDQVVECTGNSSAQVTLDGSASTDPNNDITAYEWFEHFGTPEEALLGTGVTTDIVLPLGEHVITLLITDATGKTATDSVLVQVVDTTPPEVTLAVTPAWLWPPNHRMVQIHADLSVVECGDYTVQLESVTSSEPDNGLGDGDTANDIQGVEAGSEDYDFALRAERAGPGKGRTYTITYRVVDAGGLVTLATTKVTVPHDMAGR